MTVLTGSHHMCLHDMCLHALPYLHVHRTMAHAYMRTCNATSSLVVMDSLPYGGDNDCTQPVDSEHWLQSVSMQQLLSKEGGGAKTQPAPSPPEQREARWEMHGTNLCLF